MWKYHWRYTNLDGIERVMSVWQWMLSKHCHCNLELFKLLVRYKMLDTACYRVFPQRTISLLVVLFFILSFFRYLLGPFWQYIDAGIDYMERRGPMAAVGKHRSEITLSQAEASREQTKIIDRFDWGNSLEACRSNFIQDNIQYPCVVIEKQGSRFLLIKFQILASTSS